MEARRLRDLAGARDSARALCAGLGACVMWLSAWAQPLPTESGVKAAYLFQFLAYVGWPAEASPKTGEPFVVGVMGAAEVAEVLPAIVKDRLVNGHPVTIRAMREGDALNDMHVLFVGRSVSLSKVTGRLGTRPVLLVTEDGLSPGSMLNFRLVDGRVRFEAAPAAAERAGLKLGARLLAIADRVAVN